MEYQSYAIAERNYADILRQLCGSIKEAGLGTLKPFMLCQRGFNSDFIFNEGREDQNSIGSQAKPHSNDVSLTGR